MSIAVRLLPFAISVSLFAGCEPVEGSESWRGQSFMLDGRAEKGPFTGGSQVSVHDLDVSLAVRGEPFLAQVSDDDGTFAVTVANLVSPFVRASVDGFYFNEVSGAPSDARVVLTALHDVTVSTDLNVNVLTHLERPRVEYLLSIGMPLEDARAQAQSEVLAIFEVAPDTIGSSEQLTIAGGRADDAILLAVSAIVQGERTAAEVTDLMSTIAEDLREDGVLNDGAAGSALVNAATLLDVDAVRQNVFAHYTRADGSITVLGFENHVWRFVNETTFEFTASVEYPRSADFGDNVLDPERASFTPGPYSLSAELPRGASLRVDIHKIGDASIWFYGENDGWDVSEWDGGPGYQSFTVEAGRQDAILQFWLDDQGGDARIEYFENGALTPSFSKEIAW
jgi:hypothetical protein